MLEFSEFKVLNHFDRIQQVLSGSLPPPVTLELDPTNACNHNCIWCVDKYHRKNHKTQLPKDVALQTVRQAKQFGVKTLVIKGGGEPLVYPHIEDLLLTAHDAGLEIGIITNGEKIIDHKEVIEKTCSWLRISVDAGSSEVHRTVHRPRNKDAFKKICKGISAVGNQVFCGVIYIIHPLTYHEMGIAARKVKESGCRYIGFKRVISEENLFDTQMLVSCEANFQFAKKQYESDNFSVMGFRIYNFETGNKGKPYDRCFGHHLVGIVAADGEMYACCSTRGREKYSFGNIKEKSFTEIWHGPQRQKVLEKVSEGECKRYCLGHTSYMRYDHYNELFNYLTESQKPHANFL